MATQNEILKKLILQEIKKVLNEQEESEDSPGWNTNAEIPEEFKSYLHDKMPKIKKAVHEHRQFMLEFSKKYRPLIKEFVYTCRENDVYWNTMPHLAQDLAEICGI